MTPRKTVRPSDVPYRNYFRITNLPEPGVLATVFARIEEALGQAAAAAAPVLQIVGSTGKVRQH